MTIPILTGVIILLLFIIEKQREYIQTIKEISQSKSRQIETQHETIKLLTDKTT